jgi:GT2 family glycosyltransferase
LLGVRLSKVCIVILNWNGWRDTLECLESVFRLDYPNYQVVLCDNGSRDDSLSRVKSWADGRTVFEIPDKSPLQKVKYCPLKKPIPYTEYSKDEAEAGGVAALNDKDLILIQTGANLGFAGGNNVGLRHVLMRGDSKYVWLLNNDTVVHCDALSRLVERMGESGAGICGSTIPFYAEPEKIWARGGATYNKWLARPKCIGLFEGRDLAVDRTQIENRMAFVAGASMLVSVDFLREIGVLCEDFFLYYEELDWALRARGRYRLAFAPESIVYHKVSASIRLDEHLRGGSVAAYYMCRNAMRITYKFFPVALPFVVPSVLMTYVAQRAGSRLRSTRVRLVRRLSRVRAVCTPRVKTP